MSFKIYESGHLEYKVDLSVSKHVFKKKQPEYLLNYRSLLHARNCFFKKKMGGNGNYAGNDQ